MAGREGREYCELGKMELSTDSIIAILEDIIIIAENGISKMLIRKNKNLMGSDSITYLGNQIDDMIDAISILRGAFNMYDYSIEDNYFERPEVKKDIYEAIKSLKNFKSE